MQSQRVRSVKKVLNSTTISATIRSSESQQVSAYAITSPVRAVYTFSSCGRERMQRQLSTPEMPIFPREEDEEADDLEAKPERPPPVRSSSSAERYIHLIPVLTVLCFVILFICSHAPSSSDMASFGGKAAAGSGKPKSL